MAMQPQDDRYGQTSGQYAEELKASNPKQYAADLAAQNSPTPGATSAKNPLGSILSTFGPSQLKKDEQTQFQQDQNTTPIWTGHTPGLGWTGPGGAQFNEGGNKDTLYNSNVAGSGLWAIGIDINNPNVAATNADIQSRLNWIKGKAPDQYNELANHFGAAINTPSGAAAALDAWSRNNDVKEKAKQDNGFDWGSLIAEIGGALILPGVGGALVGGLDAATAATVEGAMAGIDGAALGGAIGGAAYGGLSGGGWMGALEGGLGGYGVGAGINGLEGLASGAGGMSAFEANPTQFFSNMASNAYSGIGNELSSLGKTLGLTGDSSIGNLGSSLLQGIENIPSDISNMFGNTTASGTGAINPSVTNVFGTNPVDSLGIKTAGIPGIGNQTSGLGFGDAVSGASSTDPFQAAMQGAASPLTGTDPLNQLLSGPMNQAGTTNLLPGPTDAATSVAKDAVSNAQNKSLGQRATDALWSAAPGGALMLANSLMNQTPAAQTALAGNAAIPSQAANQLYQQYQSGQLPAAMESQMAAAEASDKEAAELYFAKAGMSDSTAHADKLSEISQQYATLRGQALQGLLTQSQQMATAGGSLNAQSLTATNQANAAQSQAMAALMSQIARSQMTPTTPA